LLEPEGNGGILDLDFSTGQASGGGPAREASDRLWPSVPDSSTAVTAAGSHRNRNPSGRGRHRGPRPGLADQGPDELVLSHGMPAGNTMLLGEAGQIADGLFLKAG